MKSDETEQLIKELRQELHEVTCAHYNMRKQRDEARREICYLLSNDRITAPHIAKSRGWDMLFIS